MRKKVKSRVPPSPPATWPHRVGWFHVVFHFAGLVSSRVLLRCESTKHSPRSTGPTFTATLYRCSTSYCAWWSRVGLTVHTWNVGYEREYINERIWLLVPYMDIEWLCDFVAHTNNDSSYQLYLRLRNWRLFLPLILFFFSLDQWLACFFVCVCLFHFALVKKKKTWKAPYVKSATYSITNSI